MVEVDEEGEELETNRRVVTLGRVGEEGEGVWQWRGRREEEGWLYWREGEDKVIFLYPDLTTGLEGRWREGRMDDGREVLVVGQRCRGGVKELLVERVGSVVWGEGVDPHDRMSVYVGESGIPGAGEGLYARRPRLPGQLVAYQVACKIAHAQSNPPQAGRKRFVEDFLFPNLTEAEVEEAAAYYFNLWSNSPGWWGLPAGQVPHG